MGIADAIEEQFESVKEQVNKLKMENYELTRMMLDISYKLCEYDIEKVRTNFPELSKKLFNIRIEHLKTTFMNVFFCDLSENYFVLNDVVENYREQYKCKKRKSMFFDSPMLDIFKSLPDNSCPLLSFSTHNINPQKKKARYFRIEPLL
jgi:hypothetical protein